MVHDPYPVYVFDDVAVAAVPVVRTEIIPRRSWSVEVASRVAEKNGENGCVKFKLKIVSSSA